MKVKSAELGRHSLAFVAALSGSLLLAMVASGAGARPILMKRLLWMDQVDLAGRFDIALAVAAERGRVFAAGSLGKAPGNEDFFVRAYDARTGVLLWEDQVDKGGHDRARAIAVESGRVFVAGTGSGPFGDDFLIRTYDARTGALLWEDQVGRPGGDSALAIAVERGRAFAVGFGRNAAGNDDFLVRAYDARTGALLWEDQADKGGADVAVAVAAEGSAVYAVGTASDAAFNRDFVVRAYDARTGALLWEDRVDKGGNLDDATDVAVERGRVFVSGQGISPGRGFDFLVRAYDARTGALLWEDQVDRGGTSDQARAIAVARGRVFAAGHRSLSFLVRAYDARTGEFLWEDDLEFGDASDIAVERARVFAAGTRLSALLVRAYDARSGAVLWTDEFSPISRLTTANAIAANRGRVFAVGGGTFVEGNFDFLVRAYRAK